MATAGSMNRTGVRLNSADWDILRVMADGRRYTQQHLYDDVPELEEHSGDWIRQRISHLREIGLVQKIGSSAMYEISTPGIAALEIFDEQAGKIDYGPDFGREVYRRAEEIDRDAWLRERLFGK